LRRSSHTCPCVEPRADWLPAADVAAAADEDRVSDFEVKLMDIDSEHLGIPDTDYAATIHMPASEYQRICRDLSSIGDTGALEASLIDMPGSPFLNSYGLLLGCSLPVHAPPFAPFSHQRTP
jgi:hypothetical protein